MLCFLHFHFTFFIIIIIIFFSPFFLFFYYTSCTLFPTNKPLHPQCRRLIILEYEGELYRVEVEVKRTEVNKATNFYALTVSGYSQSCSANSLQVENFLIRRAALLRTAYGASACVRLKIGNRTVVFLFFAV